MKGPYEAIQVTDRVWWVGAIDWKIREFHGYATHRGSTYNAFLIISDKVTLVDTVKAPFCDEMLSRIASVIEPSKIDYILSNHSELDHTGALLRTIEVCRPEKVFASSKGAQALEAHFHAGIEVEAVKNGERRDFGGAHITFLETRMLHWPDSMFAYLEEEQMLFSQDAFGMHLASSERFADEISKDILHLEAAKYYANILLPFSPLVSRTLTKISGMDMTFKIIAPDHGPIYRRDTDWIVERYVRWAAREPSMKAVVVFDTMWESTSKMARAVEEGLRAGGAAPVVVMPLGSNHRSDVATQILDASALLVGSPTLNNHIFPTVADVLTYVEGLRPRNLVGGAFGSFGWSGESVARIEAWLERMKVKMPAQGIRTKYVPDNAALMECRKLGEAVAEALAAQISCDDSEAKGATGEE